MPDTLSEGFDASSAEAADAEYWDVTWRCEQVEA